METIYKGQRFSVEFNGAAFGLRSESGRHYCNDGYCEYCSCSTTEHDAHEYSCAFPKSSFTDDLGNKWEYVGVYSSDSSASYGWWHDCHHWSLKKGGGKNGRLRTADPINIQKIRRRVEDRLRKINDEKLVIEIAVRLGVSLA